MNCYPKFDLYGSLIHAFGLLFILLSGCAVTPDNWAFTKEVIQTDKLAQINRIALLDVPPPSNIQLGSMMSDDAAFWLGFYGSLAVENTEGNIITSGSRVAETTQKELKDWLEQAGVEVLLTKAERTKQSKMLKDYSQFTQIDADAILEVAPIRIGFIDDTNEFELPCAFPPCKSEKDLSPDVLYKFRLVSAKSGEVLIESNVFYSSFYHYYQSYNAGLILLGPREHIFENEDFVREQPEEAVRRLQHAIKGATKAISEVVTNTSEPVSFIKPGGEIDLSGVYDVKIKRELMPGYGSTNKYYCFNQRPRFPLVLIQEGNIVKGNFLSGKGEIRGFSYGGGVQFNFTTSRCPNLKRGEWYLNPDGSSLHGYGWSEVKWKLQKIQ